METVANVVDSAKRFIFISQRNRASLERALCRKLNNAFHSVNALPGTRLLEAAACAEAHPVKNGTTAKFFNLGRFSPKDKAQHLLLEAFAGEEWKNRDWQLSFIGVSASGKMQMEKLITFYGLEKNRIRIIEHTEKVFAEIIQHDVLLMPSLSEGTPFAMIESMACARPALGTPVGGIPELISDGQTGWLAASTSLDDIKKALEKTWDQKEQWARIGKNAQQRVQENYNQEQSFTKLVQLLEQDTNA
jgi:glycosyltransferase involved in cell wall biosynthesis